MEDFLALALAVASDIGFPVGLRFGRLLNILDASHFSFFCDRYALSAQTSEDVLWRRHHLKSEEYGGRNRIVAPARSIAARAPLTLRAGRSSRMS